MIITIYAGYLADTDLYSQWCIERAKIDPLFAKCFEDCSCFGELAIEKYAKRKKVPWRKRLSVNYLPHQVNERGDVDISREHTVFAFREYEYTGLLANLSRWDLFQETDIDREYKAQIEELGIELGPWTLVGIVGRQGLFYNFSPEVAAAILERMNAKYNQMEDAKTKRAAQTAQVAKPKKPKKGSKTKANAMATNPAGTPVEEGL
ncbi:unnamed protein product [Rhizoctonia solani]|uniref:Uncharacterized protein n=1 Tax=Rhizoctonia solani TaxID=456999 RepID=A0A8H3CBJ3_9AGAM|nr:unnamed protein product [Rhizoctonia solani]